MPPQPSGVPAAGTLVLLAIFNKTADGADDSILYPEAMARIRSSAAQIVGNLRELASAAQDQGVAQSLCSLAWDVDAFREYCLTAARLGERYDLTNDAEKDRDKEDVGTLLERAAAFLEQALHDESINIDTMTKQADELYRACIYRPPQDEDCTDVVERLASEGVMRREYPVAPKRQQMGVIPG